jgi:hypothetical protein
LPAAWVAIGGAWLVSRALVVACAVVAQATGFPDASFHGSVAHDPVGLLALWDGYWYRIVGEYGYLPLPGFESDVAFFPLLPILLRALHIVGVPWALGGVVLANLGFLVGLVGLYELGREWLAPADALRAAQYAAFFPASFVCSMVYPEGVAFAALTLAGLAAVRHRWLSCALCIGIGTLARPELALVAIPIFAIARSRLRSAPAGERGQAVAAILAGPIAIAAFSGYLWRSLGDPLAWSGAERAWHRSFELGGLYRALAEIPTFAGSRLWLVRDATAAVVYLILLTVAPRRGVPRSWIVAGVAIVVLPLASGTVASDMRFGLLALPVYWALATLSGRRRVHAAALAASALLLAVATLVVPYAPP